MYLSQLGGIHLGAILVVRRQKQPFSVVQQVGDVGRDVNLPDEHLRQLFGPGHPLVQLLEDAVGCLRLRTLELGVYLVGLRSPGSYLLNCVFAEVIGEDWVTIL